MTTHPIVFCGAGPGDPDLITVKGQKALAAADLVLYAGSLVPEAVLKWAPETAERVSSAAMDLDAIESVMVTAHSSGKRVVRLHTGDPSLYGAIFEQMARLEKRGIPFSVIPGVTAAFAAAAAMGIEYTLPEKTQTLILTRMAGRTPVPETESLESLARHGASMAIYLSIGMAGEVAEALARTYGKDAPCAVAFKVSHPEEKILRTRLCDLSRTVEQAGIGRHALILVGPALRAEKEAPTAQSRLYAPDFSHGHRTR